MNHRDESDEGIKDAQTDRANKTRRDVDTLGYNPDYREAYKKERDKPEIKESK